MSRILITGATGFVGRAVIAALRRDGHTLSGTTRQPDLGQGPGGIPLYRIGELGPDLDWSAAVAGAEVVVHLAARVHMMKERASKASGIHLMAHLATNAEGTMRLAEAAAKAGARRLVFMSTAKVMGEETKSRPFVEADKPAPEDAYSVSKFEAEQVLAEIAAETGMEVTILRPPLVYGPYVKGNFLSLLKLSQRAWPLPIAAIQNARSLISVGNLASAVAAAATHPNAAGETFLLSDGEDVSTPELFRRTAAALGRSSRQIAIPVPLLALSGWALGRGDTIKRLTQSLQLDSGKIQRLLEWEPQETLDQGLASTAKWFRANRDG
ncbi:MAG: NAD-dependent epimerase/dehydratase family protein [Rhodospirillaceae bacterium]|jgi:nucleoside-diphosphate-sugar epimerase|nr:NAD-dependent epimerase/dehydratase family protein [Rhodospirillaceae bacterium]MBT3884503.1 NAD-dependent epimerase/dehydratase family protein [Rhodospirillaceae bacterium]MBT4115476.1 NAD-dependent epimerase/dehydratase family protein [Rhodospirillaceae bacterium]MBT4673573.1 NAD-dependent epimerase/dehydratase family protein [Rhodospirillaceae bacterium]MBT4719846.1 NAD-dependent epimerase/dehydratase family protein [Rhodospirillaceae bacterium]